MLSHKFKHGNLVYIKENIHSWGKVVHPSNMLFRRDTDAWENSKDWILRSPAPQVLVRINNDVHIEELRVYAEDMIELVTPAMKVLYGKI